MLEVGEADFWCRYLGRIRVRTGAEGLIGQRALVIEDCRPERAGQGRGGDLARPLPRAAGVRAGEWVLVSAVEGLTLEVEPTRTRRRAESGADLAAVGEPAPGGLAGELDRLAVAVRLDVAEGAGAVVEDDVELALLDPLIEPGAAEDEPADPVDEAALRAGDQLSPVVVDVLAEGGRGLADLAGDGQLDQVVKLLGPEARGW